MDHRQRCLELVSAGKFSDAFELALNADDQSIVAYLCSQVHLHFFACDIAFIYNIYV